MSEIATTHLLHCRHCVGKNCREYVMHCNVIKTMPGGRLKIEVFGERDWNRSHEIRRIRYVDSHRVSRRANHEH